MTVIQSTPQKQDIFRYLNEYLPTRQQHKDPEEIKHFEVNKNVGYMSTKQQINDTNIRRTRYHYTVVNI